MQLNTMIATSFYNQAKSDDSYTMLQGFASPILIDKQVLKQLDNRVNKYTLINCSIV